MTRPPRRRRSRPLLKAEGRFGKEKSRSRKGRDFFYLRFTICDLRLHLVDSWQMVVGSGDISPERSEPRKRSQEGCALAVVHGTGGGSRLSRPPLCCVSIVATYPPNEVSRASGRKRGAPSPSCMAWGGGRACRDRHEWAAGRKRSRASVAPTPFLLERELDPPVAIYLPSEVSRASGRNKCDPPVRMAAISSKSPCPK